MSFITNGGSYEWKITNNLTTYGAANLVSGKLTECLYKRIGVGNVIARQLTLNMWNVTIDTDYPLVLECVATAADGTQTTIGKGTYFVDTIEKSPYSDYATIEAFDALLKTEVPYLRTGTWTATTDKALVQQIATDIGVSVATNTLALLTPTKTVDEVPSIGDNGTTSREMLSVVACMRGGNFIINDDNELELVPLIGKYDVTMAVTVDGDGLFGLKPYTLLENSDDVVEVDGNGDFQVIAYSSVTDSTELWYVGGDGLNYVGTLDDIEALSPVVYPTITIGNEVVQFDVAPTETITRVEVWGNSAVSYRSPSGLSESAWNALGGTILSVNMPIMASQDLADELYGVYEDFAYIPFTAEGAYFDPDTPLGVSLSIKNDTVVLADRTLTIDQLSSCDLDAEATQAVVSYYPYISPVERKMADEIEGNRTSITANEDAITAEAVRAQGAEEELSSTFTQTAEGLRVDLNDYKNEVASYLKYESGTLTLGEQGTNFQAKLDNTKLAFTGADGTDAAWISNTQLNIKEAVIEKDEKFKGSAGNWVQQVVNDHFQIKWVAN